MDAIPEAKRQMKLIKQSRNNGLMIFNSVQNLAADLEIFFWNFQERELMAPRPMLKTIKTIVEA